MLQYVAAHWLQFTLAGVVLLIFLGKQAWQAGWFKGLSWPGVKSKPSLKSDLDLLLDILARAKERNAGQTASHLGQAVDALVREITA